MPAIDEGWGMPSRQRKERLEEWRSTGIGAGLQGGEIYARRGSAGGVELTNDLANPTASASATPMPQGGMRQNVPAIAANMPDDLPLAQRGSINNLGNGLGTFSQMQPGDSQLAIERFGRANEIRAQTLQNERRGGGLTIIPDSSRTPTLGDHQRARLEERQANTEFTRQRTQQSIISGMDERFTGQLERQRLQQQIQAGDIDIKRQQALGGILAGLDDPALQGDARAQAERSYLLQTAPNAYASLLGKGSSPLTAPVQRLEDEDLSAIGSAMTMNTELSRIDKQIASGELNLGLFANAKSTALNAIGAGDQNARNYASLNSTLEKLRNESLRLNTGVQTEGDAQRAWNELVTNLKSPDLVRQRLAEISALNERAIAIRTGIINNRRTGQGAAPLDVDSVLGREVPNSAQSRSASTGRPVPIETDSDYDALPSGALFVAPDGTTRRKP
ncbi:hypothetical protein ACRS3X_00910 [Ectopseudomonas hydrolytica]|uniref:hypothetical protein n=1 Tax=Ectopseudomonas hydrolytica TaxID=2493633 RepID=UPI003EE1DA7A